MDLEDQLRLPFSSRPAAADLARPKLWILAASGDASPISHRNFFIDPLTGLDAVHPADVVVLRQGSDDYLVYADARSSSVAARAARFIERCFAADATPTFRRVGPIADFLSIGFTPGRAGDPVVSTNSNRLAARTQFEQLLFTVARRRAYSASACLQAARSLDRRSAGALHEGVAAIIERESADALYYTSHRQQRSVEGLNTDAALATLRFYHSSQARFERLGLRHQVRAASRATRLASITSEQMPLPGFEWIPAPTSREASLGYAIRRACGFPLQIDDDAHDLANFAPGTGHFRVVSKLKLPDRQVVALLSGASSPYRKVAVELTPDRDGFALSVGVQDEMNQLMGRPLAREPQSDVRLISVACETLEFPGEPVAVNPSRPFSFHCRPKGSRRHDVRAHVLLKSGDQLSLSFQLANRPNKALSFS